MMVINDYREWEFDQVLIRPDLLPWFHEADLKVLTAWNGHQLLRQTGIPDKSSFSDHLPLKFALRTPPLGGDQND